MMLKVRPSPNPDLPQLPRSPFLHAVLTTPVDRTGACRFLSLPARPSPVNWRVGVHIQTSKEHVRPVLLRIVRLTWAELERVHIQAGGLAASVFPRTASVVVHL